MMKRRLNQTSGFTLIELVITIVIAGIIMVMISPYFQSGITTSHRPAQWLQDAVALQKVMENINGAYGKIPTKNSAALDTLHDNIANHPELFGVGYVVEKNEFIRFDSGNEVVLTTPVNQTDKLILKVTIHSTSNPGNQLTQLFTVRVAH